MSWCGAKQLKPFRQESFGAKVPKLKEEEDLGMTELDVTGRVSHNQGRGGGLGTLCKGIWSGENLFEI